MTLHTYFSECVYNFTSLPSLGVCMTLHTYFSECVYDFTSLLHWGYVWLFHLYNAHTLCMQYINLWSTYLVEGHLFPIFGWMLYNIKYTDHDMGGPVEVAAIKPGLRQ